MVEAPPGCAPLVDFLIDGSDRACVSSKMQASISVETSNGSCEAAPRVFEANQAPDCLVLLQIASTGKQGAELGSDECPLVMITAKIFDIHSRTVSGAEFQSRVKCPSSYLTQSIYNDQCDSTSEPGEPPNSVYEESLSEECKAFTGLKDADLVDAPSLLEALKSLDTWLTKQGLIFVGGLTDDVCDSTPAWSETRQSLSGSDRDQVAGVSDKRSFEVAVDGGTGLRLVLHQSMTQPVSLTYAHFPYLYRFIDLKKVYRLLYPKTQSLLSLPEMMRDVGLQDFDLPPGYRPELAIWVTPLISSGAHGSPLLEAEGGTKVTVSEDGQPRCHEVGYWPLLYCRNMAKLCAKMTADGANWKVYECIHAQYQPIFIKSSEEVSDNVVVRARGLPWQATDAEVQHFFRGINIASGGIALVLSKAGRRSGEAVIRFTDREQRDLALRKHRHHMNHRYIEIYAARPAEFIAAAGGNTQEAEDYLSRFTSPFQTLIRMRGLPYSVSAKEIIDFFAKARCQVQFDSDGILFVNRKDGRATGDAFVMFATDSEAERALKNHRQNIGNRYIELFRSTPAEVNQVMNAVLSQSSGSSPQIWPLAFDNYASHQKVSDTLEIQSPSLYCESTKRPLIPNSAFSFSHISMLNMLPFTVALRDSETSALPLTLSGMTTPLPSTSNYLMRIKGMPLGTTVYDILNFLGIYWQAVALHGIHLIYTPEGAPSGEAFVRFVSEQAVQLVVASKQGHPIMCATTGAQTCVQLSQATPAETVDFVSIPGSQPAVNWTTTAAFSAVPHACQFLPSGLAAPLIMQLGGLSPFLTATTVTTTTGGGFKANPRPTSSMLNIDSDLFCP
uniref:RRM domain-containing protein n=1 Tax=Mesocestoides corti TaxID=53468 RepID=A0A5K3FD00_MESCO